MVICCGGKVGHGYKRGEVLDGLLDLEQSMAASKRSLPPLTHVGVAVTIVYVELLAALVVKQLLEGLRVLHTYLEAGRGGGGRGLHKLVD